MKNYQFTLEPYKGMQTLHKCPTCNCKSLKLYIDTDTKQHISHDVGKCNHVNKCNYHYPPKQYFIDKNIEYKPTQQTQPFKQKENIKPLTTSYIQNEVFNSSLKNYDTNNFIKYLISLFGVSITNELIKKYFIGTSKHWNGSTVFWQIDVTGNKRTGEIILYSPTTGKRTKFNTWVHSALKLTDYNLKQCFFGEHLINNNNKPIAIVESAKTSIIASIYLPQFNWLACSGLNGLNVQKCEVLKNRDVTLFPDLKAGFEKWNEKAKELSYITKFKVFDYIELQATEKEKKDGLDIADYLTRFDIKEFT